MDDEWPHYFWRLIAVSPLDRSKLAIEVPVPLFDELCCLQAIQDCHIHVKDGKSYRLEGLDLWVLLTYLVVTWVNGALTPILLISLNREEDRVYGF